MVCLGYALVVEGFIERMGNSSIFALAVTKVGMDQSQMTTISVIQNDRPRKA